MSDRTDLERQQALVSSMAAMLEAQAGAVALHETHISWVLIAGGHAYKLKKAVRFDFVDFSTLAARHFYCNEELRLNTRLAPGIYLDVVPIVLENGLPVPGGIGTPVEYAVRMRAFAQEALWSHRLREGLLSGAEIDALADLLADFHGQAPVAPVSSAFGATEALQAIAEDNLATIAARIPVPDLRQWESEQRSNLAGSFAGRKERGMIRECHGDLHGGNIVTVDGKVEAFDCIEFNDSLRWIDVMNDIAFVCMDLRFRGYSGLAARFLNRYLEAGGDYDGLSVLRYYEVHRALIRCKVALLRMEQGDASQAEREACRQQADAYLAFARERVASSRPAIMITHGFSGSGKSTVARQIVAAFDAIQLRSDVERKRMHGMAPTTKGEAGLYAPDVTQLTYERLAILAAQAVQNGWPVVADAAFLDGVQRRRFRDLAAKLGMPFLVLDICASEATMRERLAERERLGGDASDAGAAVLARQLANHDVLTEEERQHTVAIDAETSLNAATLQRIQDLLQRSQPISERR